MATNRRDFSTTSRHSNGNKLCSSYKNEFLQELVKNKKMKEERGFAATKVTLIKSTKDELNDVVKADPEGCRVGSTNNVPERMWRYDKKYDDGICYYADTDNKKNDEQELLNAISPDNKHNIQQKSNANGEEGYVYILKPAETKK